MNLSEQWALLFQQTTASDSVAFDNTVVSHGTRLRLKVIYSKRKQALLVPADKSQAHHAVSFFIHKPSLKYWGHLCIELDHYLPWFNLLPNLSFEHFPIGTLFGESTLKSAQQLPGIALFCGFPGPLQKLTVYCPDTLGGLGKVAKLAVHATADAAIEKEAYWLEKLSQSAAAPFLPQLLQHGALACKRNYFTMTSLPKGVSSKTFGNAHHKFLRALAQQEAVFTEWKMSEAHTRLKHRIDSLSAIVDDDTWVFLQQMVSEIERMTAGVVLPNLMIHGDFAPWNLRQIDDALYVFDWEYAQTLGNPVQDFLHFHLVTQALKRGGLSNKFMSILMQQTIAYADKQCGHDLELGKASGALTMHYLLDTITFYALASGYLDKQHPVLRCYINMLQQRAQWLPKVPALATKQHLAPQSYDTELELIS